MTFFSGFGSDQFPDERGAGIDRFEKDTIRARASSRNSRHRRRARGLDCSVSNSRLFQFRAGRVRRDGDVATAAFKKLGNGLAEVLHCRAGRSLLETVPTVQPDREAIRIVERLCTLGIIEPACIPPER
jgi:hypothetical protein